VKSPLALRVTLAPRAVVKLPDDVTTNWSPSTSVSRPAPFRTLPATAVSSSVATESFTATGVWLTWLIVKLTTVTSDKSLPLLAR
jgi:hypothetical protein